MYTVTVTLLVLSISYLRSLHISSVHCCLIQLHLGQGCDLESIHQIKYREGHNDRPEFPILNDIEISVSMILFKIVMENTLLLCQNLSFMCLDLDVISKRRQTSIGLGPTVISISVFQISYRISKSDSFQALISIEDNITARELLRVRSEVVVISNSVYEWLLNTCIANRYSEVI